MTRTLFYCGTHSGHALMRIVNNYDVIYGFEANPMLAFQAQILFKDFPNVKIYNVALCQEHNVDVDFNIASFDASSSIGQNFHSKWHHPEIKMIHTIKVKAMNLLNFCKENNIDYIDHYISDLQGADFMVLNTLKEYIDNKKIKLIQSEVNKNDKENIYTMVKKICQNFAIQIFSR